ncbi:DedA family protein [Rhizobium fabae]|uniref:Alkaline phosphatase n=1 Tax=Rhizobium fabae TaxID=573179 RepID=A0A7W6B2J3_9HYPH|nr:DedA family protein [Rhizobium fabae]MBB3914395.1 alkaline phosphatase [Rhizobium fabae]RUM14679.1 DedA family protein [Rhizobium fabae]
MMADTIYTPLLYGGFLSIVALALAEKLVPVIPSYALLVFLGMTHASDTKGFISTVAASALGSMLGTLVWYGVGRLAGRNLIEVWIDKGGRYVFLPLARYRALAELYERHTFWITLTAQTIPTVRIFLAMPAGMLGLNLRLFIPASMLGIVIWNTSLIGIGAMVGNSRYDPLYSGLLVVAAILCFEAAIWHSMRYRRRRPA